MYTHVAVTDSCLFTCLLQQDRVMVQTVENHPMAAGFNNISVSMLCIYKSNAVLIVLKCVIQYLAARGKQ